MKDSVQMSCAARPLTKQNAVKAVRRALSGGPSLVPVCRSSVSGLSVSRSWVEVLLTATFCADADPRGGCRPDETSPMGTRPRRVRSNSGADSNSR
jgi:hypothetical protein